MALENSTALDSANDELHSRVSDALIKLSAYIRTVRNYSRVHPVCTEMIGETHSALVRMLDIRPSITLVIDNQKLIFDNFPLEDNLGALASLTEMINNFGILELRLTSGLSSDELAELAEALSMSPQDIAQQGGFARELEKRHILHISAGGYIAFKESSALKESGEHKDTDYIYEEALGLVEASMQAVDLGTQIPVAEIMKVVSNSIERISDDDVALVALAGIRSYDRYSSEHSMNVCILCLTLAHEMGLDTATSLQLGTSAMLHDVGKVCVPAEIVKKPGKLTETEWEMMRMHPVEGARALAGVQGLPAIAPMIALEHHYYCDGSGYPTFSVGHKPHLLSRLVSIVDTYDALTTDRPYRERWSGQKAVAWMMYHTVNKYDPQLLSMLAAKLGLYPLWALVRLVCGEMAVVTGGSMDNPTKPIITLVSGRNSKADTKIIDLSTNTDPALEIEAMAHPAEALLPMINRLMAA